MLVGMNEGTSDDIKVKPIETISFIGDSVENGEVDLHKTIEYLKGLEKATKYFIVKENPEFTGKDFSLEVRIRPGSLVTDIIGIVLAAGVTSIASAPIIAYTKTAVGKLAENDVGDKTTADVARSGLSAMKSVMEIAQHRGTMMRTRNFKQEEVKAVDADNIILTNSKGKKRSFTKREVELYRETPRTEFREMMALLERDTKMYFGQKPVDDVIPEGTLEISPLDRAVFDDRENRRDERLLFPELMQDQRVILRGELTRGNGRTHTLGFSYDNRILKAIPPNGDVKSVRDKLFGEVQIEAIVDRRSAAKGSNAVLKKPVLRIVNITGIDKDEEIGQPKLPLD